MSGRVFIVPTPIGNLGDITLRAIDILSSVDTILAEDTRTTGLLLKKYEIATPQKSYHIHNEHKQVHQIIALLQSGKDLALVSDAGTPGISDPGYLLIREALKNEIEVEALPGPTAFVPALLKSGFPCDKFIFEGFLPHKKGRVSRIAEYTSEKRTVVFYESPHRIKKTLEQFQEAYGPNRLVSISREITKKFEETITGSIEELLGNDSIKNPKGEFVLILAGVEKQEI